jgi:hypothetical protein
VEAHLEKTTKTLIKTWAKKRDIWLFMPIPSAFGASTGCSDFLGCLNDGTMLCIEAKKAGAKAKVTANQQKFIDNVNERGGIGVVVSCQEDLDELDMLIAARTHVVMYDN